MGSTTGDGNQAGQKIGKFEIIDTIGHGGFGTVYKARDPELGPTVAVKAPPRPAHSGSAPEGWRVAGEADARRRLWEWDCLNRTCHPEMTALQGHTEMVNDC